MNITDFDVRPNSREDAAPAVQAALHAMKENADRKLVFRTGRYDFWPEFANEAQLFISNNDSGLKRIAFYLEDIDDVEIDAQESEFVFHGAVTPFAIRNCCTVRLQGFSVDYERTFCSEMSILDAHSVGSAGRGSVDLSISPAYPYRIDDGRLLFLGEGCEPQRVEFGLEFDPKRRESAFRVSDLRALRVWHSAKELQTGAIRLTADFETLPTPSNTLVLAHFGRECPGIFVENSRQIDIRDVTLYHSGAMGLIAQWTSDIRLTRLRVMAAPGKDRLVSLIADATHFANCRGLIEVNDCHFEAQLDDPMNVHGLYGRISHILSARELEVENVHSQQASVDITRAGDIVEFVENESLMRYHEAPVAKVKRIDERFSHVTIDGDVPPNVKPGDVIGTTRWMPDLMVRGSRFEKNRARGVLATSAGKVLIENNYFHTAGAAILIEGDANYWFESGSVRDVTIRNNRFHCCNYGVWGRATIDVNPQVASTHRAGAHYHKGITIEGNLFEAFDLRLVKAHCVDGITIRGNTVRQSGNYPAQPLPESPWDITNSKNVLVTENVQPDTGKYR